MSIKGQGHSLVLVKCHSEFKIKTCFFSETIESFETKIRMKAYWRIGIKSHDQDGHNAHIWLKSLKISFSRTNGQMALELGV